MGTSEKDTLSQTFPLSSEPSRDYALHDLLDILVWNSSIGISVFDKVSKQKVKEAEGTVFHRVKRAIDHIANRI